MLSNKAESLTRASLNCQKLGFVRSLIEEGRTVKMVNAKLEKKDIAYTH